MLGWKHEHHSLEQIAFIQQLSKRADLQTRESLYLATQFVNHGFPGSFAFLRELQKRLPSKAAQDYVIRLKKRNRIIQDLPSLRSLHENSNVVRQLYETSGYCLRPGSLRRDTAVIIFTTKFNNFTFSNLVMDAIFHQLGVTRLFLRDGSQYTYFGGVRGLANSLSEIPAALGRLLAEQGIKQSIVTGYSSGGYPSLYVATRMNIIGYVGYSITSDISAGTQLPVRSMYERLMQGIDPTLLRDLRQDIVESGTLNGFIHYGQRHAIDRAHAEHLEGIEGVDLICHTSARHEVTAHLLEEGRFLDPFIHLTKMIA